jgi:hypothetical protein
MNSNANADADNTPDIGDKNVKKFSPSDIYYGKFEKITDTPEAIKEMAMKKLTIGTIGAIISFDEGIPWGSIVEVTGEPEIKEHKENPKYNTVVIPVRYYRSNMSLTRQWNIQDMKVTVMRDGTIRWFERARTEEVASEIRAGFDNASDLHSDMKNRIISTLRQ